MTLRNKVEVENTRRKLEWLERTAKEVRERPDADKALTQATLRSLFSTIKDLREEILRYEAQERELARGNTS